MAVAILNIMRSSEDLHFDDPKKIGRNCWMQVPAYNLINALIFYIYYAFLSSEPNFETYLIV